MAERHLAKIDFLRGIAILMVFVFHIHILLFPVSHEIAYTKEGFMRGADIDKIIRFLPSAFGWSGVQLFLLISGFLIHNNHLKAGEVFNSRIFFSKRFWRIYPPYLFALLGVVLLTGALREYIATTKGFLDFIQHIFLVHNFSEDNFYSINPSLWSLALEMQLYLLYPVFLILRKWWGIEKSFGFTLFIAVMLKLLENNLTGGVYYDSYYFSTGALWYNWCAGALLAEYHFKGKLVFKGQAGAVSIFALLVFWGSRYFQIHLYLMLVTAIGFWTAFMEWYLINPSIIVRKKIFSIVSAVGICSYSFYLIHQPIMNGIYAIFRQRVALHWPYYLIPGVLILIVTSFGIYALAKLLYRYVELPVIKYGVKRRNETLLKKGIN